MNVYHYRGLSNARLVNVRLQKAHPKAERVDIIITITRNMPMVVAAVIKRMT